MKDEEKTKEQLQNVMTIFVAFIVVSALGGFAFLLIDTLFSQIDFLYDFFS